MSDVDRLADEISGKKPGWLPISGHIVNFTVTLEERDLIVSALRADRERLWCQACGTVTRDGVCDCNRYPVGHEMRGEPNFVNYADQLQKDARELAVELERIRADPVRSAAQPMRDIPDKELAAWARNWHWNDCAGDRPVDPSIYPRDMRMLKAFILKARAALTPASANEGKDEAGVGSDRRAESTKLIGPYNGPMTIDAGLLHALWCYGVLNPVINVVYGYGTHLECLKQADRILFNRTQALAAAGRGK